MVSGSVAERRISPGMNPGHLLDDHSKLLPAVVSTEPDGEVGVVPHHRSVSRRCDGGSGNGTERDLLR